MLKQWQCKLLSVVLCASLIAPNLSVSAYAVETSQTVQSGGEVIEFSEDNLVTDDVPEGTTPSTENTESSQQESGEASGDHEGTESGEGATGESREETSGEVEGTESGEGASEENGDTESGEGTSGESEGTENEEEISGETEEAIKTEENNSEKAVFEETATETTSSAFGSFENVQISFYSLNMLLGGVFHYAGSETEEEKVIYLVQYDKEMNRLCSAWMDSVSGTEASSVYLYDSVIRLHENTAYVRLEISSGDDTVSSDIFSRPEIQDFTLEAEADEVGAGCIDYVVSCNGMEIAPYIGADIQMVLNGGTSENEETWEELSYTSCGFQDSKLSDTVRFKNLRPETTYYGELVFYNSAYDYKTNTTVRLFEQRVAISSFTTKANDTYDLETTFPDAVLRGLISSKLSEKGWGVEDGIVTSQMLEDIEQISNMKSSFETEAITDLTGIELLTSLEYLYIENNEVEDVSTIDWTKLKKLKTLDLDGNNISVLPDLSQNSELSSIGLVENKLSQEELEKAEGKFPAGYTLSSDIFDRQRVNGFHLLMEENYYVYASGADIYIEPIGYKSGLPYTVKYYVDGIETNFEPIYYNDTLCALKNSALSSGNHTLKAELYAEGVKVEETLEYTFSIVEQDIFAEKVPYYINSDVSDITIRMNIYSIYNKTVSSAELVDSSGKVYAEENSINLNYVSGDPRFEVIKDTGIDEGKVYEAYTFLEPVYHTIPVGYYDFILKFSDGTSQKLKDAVIVVEKSETVLNKCYIGDGFDNTGEYIYVVIEGKNINPAQLEYVIEQNGKKYPVKYVNHKPTYSGVAVKLQKEDWNSLKKEDSIQFTITGGSEAATITANGNLYSGLIYAAYNSITKKIEAVLSADTNSDGKTVTVSMWKDYDTNILAEGSAVVSDGVVYVELKNSDGTTYMPASGNYSLGFQVGNMKYITTVYINHPYGITVESYGTTFACIMEEAFDQSKEYDTEAQATSEKFIVNDTIVYWKNKSEIELYVSTPDSTASDEYTVSLADGEGNQVSGLTTKVVNRYSSGIYLSVTGLEYEDAAKSYYVKVTHNTLGEPYTSDGSKFYTDERGTWQQITYSPYGYSYDMQRAGRVAGITLQGAELPVTLGIYKSYQTEPIKEVKVTDTSQLSGDAYYFTKSFYDSLPEKDSLHQIVCADNNQNVSVFNNIVIGYKENAVTIWGYTIDKTELYINEDENKKATVTIFNSKGKPTYKSSDTNVVTIKADAENPNKAVITAVGIGTAEITITADGITRKIPVTSSRRVTLEALELNKSEIILGVGESQELTAAVLPIEAWNEALKISFTTENADIIGLDDAGEEADTVVITALKEGTAVVKAVVTDSASGIERTAECIVTVKNVHSKEKQEELVAEAGTQYVLLNIYPKMEATLKDVALPEGWTWADDSVKLIADDGVPIQYYTAEYSEEGYESFTAALPVAVSKMTGVKIVDEYGNIVENITLRPNTWCSLLYAEGKYIGYKPIEDEYEEYFACQWIAKGKITVVEIEVRDEYKSGRVANFGGKEVTKKTTQVVNLVVAVGGKEYKTSLNINVYPDGCISTISVSANQIQLDTVVEKYELNRRDYILTVDSSGISTENDNVHNTLRLLIRGIQYVDGDGVYSSNLKYSSSDTSVVEVKAEKDNKNVVLTFKKAGSAILRIVAQDEGKYEKEVLIFVRDCTPILETNKISLDMYSSDGAVIPVKPQNGNNITGIEIQEQDSKTKEWKTSTKFGVKAKDSIFYVEAKEGYAPTKNENVKVQLQITTADGETTSKAVTISVNAKTKPTASVKAISKANLFEMGAEAKYKITSKYEIESIEDITIKEDGNYRGRTAETGFRLKTVDVANGELWLGAGDTLSAKTLAEFKAKKSPLCQVKIKVNFKGYAAPQEITITVATEDKKPSLKLNDIILLSGMAETTTQVYDTKAKAVYLADASDVTLTSKTNNVAVNVTEDGKVNVAYSGTKSVNYKAEMTSVYWTQPLTISGKITVSEPKKQNIVLENAKVILNTEHNIQNNGKLAIAVSVKNNDTEVEKVNYQIDKKNAKLFNNGYLSITFSKKDQMLYVGLNKNMRGDIKAGNYKINLVGKIMVDGVEQSLKATTLTVTLAEKSPKVSFKAKGSIDLVRRQDSSIVYTPTYQNVTAVAEDVKLSGAYAEYFNATVEDGNVTVTAKEDKAMSTKISYPLTLNLTLDNGCEVSSTMKMKPVNKLPKLTAKMTKATLYKTSPEEISYQIITNDSKTSISRIERVEDKNSKYFNFTTEGDMVTVSLTEEAGKMKPGKYTVSYKVYMEGAAYNVKPTTLKLTVTVK